MLPLLEPMRVVARRLTPVKIPFAFVGGTALSMLVDNPELTDLRPTLDVDVVVSVASYAQYAELDAALRNAGFQHDLSEGAPICRWVVGNYRVDIMPQESTFLGMNSKWFAEVMESATEMDLGEECSAKVVSPACFLATKLEAFKDRGGGDFYGSKDIEDIVTLVDGRRTIVADVMGSKVRGFVSSEFARLLQIADFLDALPGHLSQKYDGGSRLELVRGRFGRRQAAPNAGLCHAHHGPSCFVT